MLRPQYLFHPRIEPQLFTSAEPVRVIFNPLGNCAVDKPHLPWCRHATAKPLLNLPIKTDAMRVYPVALVTIH